MNTEIPWDKRIAHTLRSELKLSQDQLGVVLGIIAEERQIADRVGYKRGFEAGIEDASRQERHNYGIGP